MQKMNPAEKNRVQFNVLIGTSTVQQGGYPYRPIAPMYYGIIHRLVVLCALFLPLNCTAEAQTCNNCGNPEAKVGFSAKVCSHQNFTITLNNKLLSGNGTQCNNTDWIPTNKEIVALVPNVSYQLQAGTNICSVHISFEVPLGYTMYIDGQETNVIDKGDSTPGHGDGTWSIVVRKRKNSCDCETAIPAEYCESGRGGVIWGVKLGQLSNGKSAENITIYEKALSSNSYTPAALIYTPPPQTSEVDVVRVNNVLRQVNAPQTLADVVTINSSEFEVRFYRPADVGNKVNGIYTLTGQPFITWKIKNPTPGTAETFQLSKIQGSLIETSEFNWNAAANSWTLTTGNSERIETATSSISGAVRTETVTVKNSNNQTFYKAVNTWTTFVWGEELTQQVVDPDVTSLTTVYQYYTDPNQPGKYGKLLSVTNPDGSWEKYDYDAYGNKIQMWRPWKDTSLGSANTGNSVITYYTYSNDDGKELSLFPKVLDSVEEKIGNVRLSYTTYDYSALTVSGEPAVKEVETVFTSTTVSEVTTTVRYYRTASAFLSGRTVSIEYPDGRKDSYSYEKGDYTANTDPAQSIFTPNTNGLAERITITHGTINSLNGIAYKTTKETAINNQYGQQVLRETYVYTGSGYERIEWQVSEYNDRGRPVKTIRSNGQYTNTYWDQDRKISEVGETGIETVYTDFDQSGRPRTVIAKGVSANGSFPAQPDIVTTYTFDPEGRVLNETRTSGTLSLSRSNTYDIAGRIKTSTDNAGLVTSYSYSNGGRTQTTTMPGGTTATTDKYLDGRTKSVTGTAVVTNYSDYGFNTDGSRYTQLFIGSDGLSSQRWIRTTTDWRGRIIKTEKPSFNSGITQTQTERYNAAGQLVEVSKLANMNKVKADLIYEYDSISQLVRAGHDVDDNGQLVALSTDRYTETETIYEKIGADWFKVTTTKQYLKDNDPTATMQTRRQRLTGFSTNGTEKVTDEATINDTGGNQTIVTTTLDRDAKKLTTTTDTLDSNLNAVSIMVNGLLQSSTPTMPRTPTTYAYDALRRPISVIDPATGTNTRAYDPVTGQLISVNDGANSMTYEYYPSAHANAGRLKLQTDVAGKKTYFEYNSRGELIRTWGQTTYPLEYVYDGYGQRIEMHTFRGGSNWTSSSWPTATTGAADVTKWNYHAASGLVSSIEDSATKRTIYTYDGLGRTKTRAWARTDPTGNTTTKYSYDNLTGDLTRITYTDGTPSVTFIYDRGGRANQIIDAAGSHTLSYSDAGGLMREEVTSGLLAGVKAEVGYDTLSRRNSLQVSRNMTTLLTQNYGYDTSGRLGTITNGNQTVTYSYYTATGLLNTTSYSGGTVISRNYDTHSRLSSITNTPASDVASSYTYQYDSLGRRDKLTREDGSYWSYGYNDRGELTSGKKFWADSTPVAGLQMEYDYDNLGNRSLAKTGGDGTGANLRQSDYTSNNLNQYTQRTVPGAIDVLGTASSDATVRVNDVTVYRRNTYFHKALPVDNSAQAVYARFLAMGVKNAIGINGEDAITQKEGYVYVPQNIESYNYDPDGNLVSDGRWNYIWDAENRLISLTAIDAAPSEAKLQLTFVYDYRGRRIEKRVFLWNTSTKSYRQVGVTRFVYDGWNLVAELDGANNLVRSYIWGQDISGSQMAGGIGGLLLQNQGEFTYQSGYDGNGNVVILINATDGKVTANYDYDAFGNLVRATGEAATQNVYKFSTKYTDQETGLVYFGYRYYHPQIGRWISRDPLSERWFGSKVKSSFEEKEEYNLYSYIDNKPNGFVDVLGLKGRALEISRFMHVDYEGDPRLVALDTLNLAAIQATSKLDRYDNPFVRAMVLHPLSGGYIFLSTPTDVTFDRTDAKIRFARTIFEETGSDAVDVILRGAILFSDQRGHVLGDQLGGPGLAYNLFPQHVAINNGPYRAWESLLRRYIDNHPCEEGTFVIRLQYGDPLHVFRPVVVQYWAQFRDFRTNRITNTFQNQFFNQ